MEKLFEAEIGGKTLRLQSGKLRGLPPISALNSFSIVFPSNGTSAPDASGRGAPIVMAQAIRGMGLKYRLMPLRL